MKIYVSNAVKNAVRHSRLLGYKKTKDQAPILLSLEADYFQTPNGEDTQSDIIASDLYQKINQELTERQKLILDCLICKFHTHEIVKKINISRDTIWREIKKIRYITSQVTLRK